MGIVLMFSLIKTLDIFAYIIFRKIMFELILYFYSFIFNVL